MDAGEDVGEARRNVEQIGDVVLALAVSMPQMVDQLVAVLARYDMPLSDQVIEVPKVSCPARCGRTVCSLYAADGRTAGGSADDPDSFVSPDAAER